MSLNTACLNCIDLDVDMIVCFCRSCRRFLPLASTVLDIDDDDDDDDDDAVDVMMMRRRSEMIISSEDTKIFATMVFLLGAVRGERLRAETC